MITIAFLVGNLIPILITKFDMPRIVINTNIFLEVDISYTIFNNPNLKEFSKAS